MVDKFPIDPSLAAWSSSVTQSWDVQIAKAASGKRRTLCQQSYPAWVFKLKFPNLTKDHVQSLTNFYAKMRGKWGSFLYKDYDNNHVEGVELINELGTNKYYCTTGLRTLAEPAEYVENLHVFINGVEVIDYTEENGVIALETPVTEDDVVTATYDYYYHVSFTDNLSITQIFDDFYSVSIGLEVVRE